MVEAEWRRAVEMDERPAATERRRQERRHTQPILPHRLRRRVHLHPLEPSVPPHSTKLRLLPVFGGHEALVEPEDPGGEVVGQGDVQRVVLAGEKNRDQRRAHHQAVHSAHKSQSTWQIDPHCLGVEASASGRDGQRVERRTESGRDGQRVERNLPDEYETDGVPGDDEIPAEDARVSELHAKRGEDTKDAAENEA